MAIAQLTREPITSPIKAVLVDLVVTVVHRSEA